MMTTQTDPAPQSVERARVKAAQDVAAGVAHELRNPVFAIASAAQLLRYRLGDDPVIEKNLGRILRESERLNAVISALLEFGRPAPVRLSPGDPDEIWSDVLHASRGLLESKAIVVQHAPANPRATCDVDAEQLAQAFTHVLDNAIDAAPEGTDATLQATSDDTGTWQCVLTNVGAPVDQEILARAFEPLSSTKLGHAGIGLPTARRIVTEHGGQIDIRSAGVSGVAVTIRLPAARHL